MHLPVLTDTDLAADAWERRDSQPQGSLGRGVTVGQGSDSISRGLWEEEGMCVRRRERACVSVSKTGGYAVVSVCERERE